MSVFQVHIKRLVSLFLILFAFASSNAVQAADNAGEAEPFNAGEVILHHVLDDHIWHFWDGHFGTLYLPIIVYSAERGLDVFSSSNFYDDNHKPVEYDGYKLDHNKIYLTESGEAAFDLSVTKNVAMLFINALVLLLVFIAVSKAYKRNKGNAPKGIQSFFEPVIVFVRDEIAKPNIGHSYQKFLPYLLTLFFFILFGNLLGLLPGAANLTGNIAVTMVLALFTFFITNFNGNKA
jgi:F-type H+-transporting ATPase subunit a